MKLNTVFVRALIILLNVPIQAFSQEPSFSRGLAMRIHTGSFDCVSKGRISAVGSIVTEDGKEKIVPTNTHFLTAPKATEFRFPLLAHSGPKHCH